MYALKRILAYAIDNSIIIAISTFLSANLTRFILDESVMPEPLKGVALSYLSLALFTGFPILALGVLSGAFGWTPGKLVFGLRIRNVNGAAPGIPQGILREIVKFVGLSFMFLGALWALYGIITSQNAFYDDWIGLDVDDLKPSGLTDTQKRWREFQREERGR